MSDEQTNWKPTVPYQYGDRVTMYWPRHWLEIWWDRITTLRWDVATTDVRTFEWGKTSSSPHHS